MRLFKMVFSQTSLKNRSKTVLSLCLLATAAVAVPRQPALGDNVAFSDVDSITTRRVAELILARHFENQPIDDEVSGQLFDSYLKAWDPNRLYFTKSDIDEFTVFRTSLDDQIRSGQLQFAKLVFDRFIVRATESQSVISSAIDQQHDFLIDESVVRKGDSRPWASSAAETKENWRKTIKLQLLNFIIDGDAIDEAKAKLKLRYSTSHNLLVQTDKDEVLELYLTSMMQCLDPHSRYFSPRSEEEFQTNMSLRLTGIGARLRHENGNTVVEEIVKGGAADSDGRLSKEDTIVAVGQGEDGGLIDIVGLKLQAVVDQIRGEVGTVVRLQVEKKGTTKRIVYRMTRQQIELEDQQVSGRIVDSGEWVNGTSGTIGLLTIPRFIETFVRPLRAALSAAPPATRNEFCRNSGRRTSTQWL